MMTEVISEVRFGERSDFLNEPNSKCWEATELLLFLVVVTVCVVWLIFFFLFLVTIRQFTYRTKVHSCIYSLVLITFIICLFY